MTLLRYELFAFVKYKRNRKHSYYSILIDMKSMLYKCPVNTYDLVSVYAVLRFISVFYYLQFLLSENVQSNFIFKMRKS